MINQIVHNHVDTYVHSYTGYTSFSVTYQKFQNLEPGGAEA